MLAIETYEVPEVDCMGETESDAEAIALIEQLGLEGQRKLVVRDDSGDDNRCPYRKMTSEEHFVFKAICPAYTELNKYADSVIPLRVLQVAAHAKEFFKHVEVWHPKNGDVQLDPVLVGYNASRYEEEFFILARWGEVLDSLDVLMPKALAKAREMRKSALSKIRAEVDALLASVDDYMPTDGMHKEDRWMPSFYAR